MILKADTLNLHHEHTDQTGDAQIKKLNTGYNFIDILRNVSLVKSRMKNVPRVQGKAQGSQEDIKEALDLMGYSNQGAGISCTFFDYTHHQQHQDIVLKLSRNRRSLLIMSKRIAKTIHQRSSSMPSCCGSVKKSGYEAQGCALGVRPGKVFISVKLASLSGFLLGPQSLQFRMLRQSNKEVLDDYDEWKFVSVVDQSSITYDFVIPSREECLKFIIGISHATAAVNRNFFGITNRRLLASQFTRMKLQRIARDRDLSVGQLMMVACFDTVNQIFPEETLDEIKIKYQSLNKLLKVCDKLKIKRQQIDLMSFYDLRSSILKSRELQHI